MACPACEIVPRHSMPDGRVYFAPAIDHTMRTMERALDDAGVGVERIADGLLTVEGAAAELDRAVEVLRAQLTPPEQDDCRIVVLAEGEPFDGRVLARAESFRVFAERVASDWLAQLLQEQRLTSHFHPIVHAADTRRIYAYEALVRGLDADGSVVSPGQLFPAARAAKLLFHLDRAARVSAIERAHEHGIDTPLFINFNPTAIYDPAFCLSTTLAAAKRTGRSPEQFVFEVVESDEIADSGHLLNILKEYRDAGFRVALDDLGAGYGSLNLLQTLKPDFVKLDMELIRDVDHSPSKQSIVRAVLNMAGELGCETVAEGIETAAEADWLVSHGASYLQGFYFAKPGNPPPAVAG